MSLDQTVLNATVRDQGGKGPARRLRQNGLIPAVVYGGGSQPLSVAVDPKLLRKAVSTRRRLNTVITLKFDGVPERTVLIKDYQMHPVTREVLHADFVEVNLDQEVNVQVPVVLSGRAEGVVAGGVLAQVRREIDIVCKPAAIPEQVTVDITSMKAGSTLHEKDFPLPEGVRLAAPHKNETIATISVPEAEPTPAAAAPVKGKGKK